MALPEYYKEYCMDGHKYRTGLDGITVNNKPVEEFLKTEDQKEVESVYQEDLSKNKNKNPVCFGKTKFKSKKERAGKVKKINPQEYYNQDPNGNFGKCKRIKDVVISLLLSGMSGTSKEFLFEIEKRSTQNLELRLLTSSDFFNLNKIYTVMYELKKSVFGTYIITKPLAYKKSSLVYWLNEEAKSFTLEEAIEISRQYKQGLSKKTIKKAVKKAKDQREAFNENQLEFLNKMLSQIVLKEEFKKYIEDINGQITDLKSLVNKLMINTPASDLNNVLDNDPFKRVFGIDSEIPLTSIKNKIQVEVQGGIEVSFRIIGLT